MARNETCTYAPFGLGSFTGANFYHPQACNLSQIPIDRLDPNPFGFQHLRRSRQAGTSDYDFEVNFIGDTNTRENSVKEVEASKLGENDEGR
jgi:hypothetical protein